MQDSLAAHISAEARATAASHLSALTNDQHLIELREESARIDDLRRYVAAGRDANIDAATFIGEVLRDLEERLTELQDDVRESNRRAPSTADELDQDLARFLNQAEGHEGYAAQRGLWFNWPVSLSYEPKDVGIGGINERIVEHPYVLRATAGLAPGSRVLDVGAAESTLALSLAALGFAVVALDPRGYPSPTPGCAPRRPRSKAGRRTSISTRFSASRRSSTSAPGSTARAGNQPALDERALAKMFELLEAGGLLVLTAPLGGGGYERARLEELLQDWEMEDFTVAEQTSPSEWSVGESGAAQAAVALISARRPG